jgi:signal transduction histidine kinase
VIVLTGFDDRTLGLQALQLGAQDYLIKGEATRSMLQRAVRYAIERGRIESGEREQRTYVEALRDALAALTSTLDLDEVLDRVLDGVGRVVPHQVANIMLIEGSEAQIVRMRPTTGQLGQKFPVNALPFLQEMLTNPALTHSMHSDAACDPTTGSSYLAAPIQLEGRVMGVINLFRDQPFQVKDSERLGAFAEQAAIALRNARLFWNTTALAALEERQRLARDLHDSVTQTLFSASVIAETIMRCWQTDPARVEALLPRLHQLSTGALAEMRVLLLELRPSALEHASMADLLKQLVQSVRSRKSLEIDLTIDNGPELPFAIKEGLYRIAQEALNNVVKHSLATAVEIHMISDPEAAVVDLTIRDNGTGFDPAARQPASLGVSIMHERAAEIGALLQLDSQPHAGTTIHVRVPLPMAETYPEREN